MYVLFTRGMRDGLTGGQSGGVMGLMRLRDAPTIAGASVALRKLHPHTKDGPVLELPMGWEPHWTYSAIPARK